MALFGRRPRIVLRGGLSLREVNSEHEPYVARVVHGLERAAHQGPVEVISSRHLEPLTNLYTLKVLLRPRVVVAYGDVHGRDHTLKGYQLLVESEGTSFLIGRRDEVKIWDHKGDHPMLGLALKNHLARGTGVFNNAYDVARPSWDVARWILNKYQYGCGSVLSLIDALEGAHSGRIVEKERVLQI